MNDKIILKRDNANLKKPFHLKNNIFLIYSPKNREFPGEFQRIDSGIVSFLLKNARGFITSKFREDKIKEILNGEQRLWMEIINKSFYLPIEISKGCVLGFFVAEPEHLKFQYETTKKIKKVRKKGQKTLSWNKKKADGRILEPV